MTVLETLPNSSIAPEPSHGQLNDNFQGQYIQGRFRAGRSAHRWENRDPFTGELLATLQLADISDLDEAYEAAAQAQNRGMFKAHRTATNCSLGPSCDGSDRSSKG